MLRRTDQLVDDTLHNFTEDTGEADGPVIPRVPLTPLLNPQEGGSSELQIRVGGGT